jgi:hypothetical protein
MNLQEQTLWERISQVAEDMRDIPEWKRGSSSNERNDSYSAEREQQNESRISASTFARSPAR